MIEKPKIYRGSTRMSADRKKREFHHGDAGDREIGTSGNREIGTLTADQRG